MIDLTVILNDKEYKMTAGVETVVATIAALPATAVYMTAWADTQKLVNL